MPIKAGQTRLDWGMEKITGRGAGYQAQDKRKTPIHTDGQPGGKCGRAPPPYFT
ncbi:MAG: hypothetical protein K0M46_02200 [Thiobacillus sp.]|nr:hypothetical protein [Thiobacillus sp.]